MTDEFARSYVHGKKVGDYDDELNEEQWAGDRVYVKKAVQAICSKYKNVEVLVKNAKTALLVLKGDVPQFFRVVSAGTADFSMYEKSDYDRCYNWSVKHHKDVFAYGNHILVKENNRKQLLVKDKTYKMKVFKVKKIEEHHSLIDTHDLNVYVDEVPDVCPVCHTVKFNGACLCN